MSDNVKETGWPRSLWLVRHGESEGNVADRLAQSEARGRLTLDTRDPDVELSDLGHKQSEALGRWISKHSVDISVAVSSPYVRALQTAQASLGPLGISVVTDERLRERDLGVFDGYTPLGVKEFFPEESERRASLGKFYYRPPGGESWADVALRVRSFLGDLRAQHAADRVMLFTHQAVLMVFRYVIEGLTEHEVLEIDAATTVANCSLTGYEHVDGGLILKSFNGVQHLKEEHEEVSEEPGANTIQ